MKLDIYLQSVGHRRYEEQFIPVSGIYLSNKNMKHRGLAGYRYVPTVSQKIFA